MIWFMRKHWLLLSILVLQLVNVGLHFHKVQQIELNMKTFQSMVLATMEFSYAAGQKDCPQPRF